MSRSRWSAGDRTRPLAPRAARTTMPMPRPRTATPRLRTRTCPTSRTLPGTSLTRPTCFGPTRASPRRRQLVLPLGRPQPLWIRLRPMARHPGGAWNPCEIRAVRVRIQRRQRVHRRAGARDGQVFHPARGQDIRGMLPYPDQFCVVADALRRRALGPPGIARPRRGHPAALGQPARCYLRQRTPHHGVSIRRRRLRHGGRHLRAQFPIRLRPDPIPRRHPAQLARIVGVPAPAGDPCAICRDEFAVGSDAAGMPCGHAFHEGCLRRHLEARADCPMCRVAL